MLKYKTVFFFFFILFSLASGCKKEVEINAIGSPPSELIALAAIQFGADEAVDFYRGKIMNKKGVEGSSILNLAGQILISVGKVTEAEEILSYALTKYPGDVELLNTLALSLVKSMSYDRAVEIYTQALEAVEKDPSVPKGMIDGIKNGLAFMKNRDIYRSYSGAYKLSRGELLICKFDPYLGTYPVCLNVETGFYKVLYPVSKSKFYYLGGNGKKLDTINFSLKNKSVVLNRNGKKEINGEKVEMTKKTMTLRIGDHSIEGDLIMPAGKGPFPAIILIHGSGYSTRYNLYLEAYFFAANGYAVFVYDKQGTGASTGKIPLETSYDALSEDALAAVKKLRKENNIDPERIGLWGHSEGGWIVPLVASKTSDVKFAVLSSGAAVGTFQQTWQAIIFKMKNNGIKGSAIEEANDYMDSLLYAMKKNRKIYDIKNLLENARNSSWGGYALVPRSDWELGLWKNLIKYAPASYLKTIKIPVLALFGEKDRSVICEDNAPLMRKYLEESGCDYKIAVIREVDHQFMLSDDKYSPKYFSVMIKWLKDNVNP